MELTSRPRIPGMITIKDNAIIPNAKSRPTCRRSSVTGVFDSGYRAPRGCLRKEFPMMMDASWCLKGAGCSNGLLYIYIFLEPFKWLSTSYLTRAQNVQLHACAKRLTLARQAAFQGLGAASIQTCAIYIPGKRPRQTYVCTTNLSNIRHNIGFQIFCEYLMAIPRKVINDV